MKGSRSLRAFRVSITAFRLCLSAARVRPERGYRESPIYRTWSTLIAIVS